MLNKIYEKGKDFIKNNYKCIIVLVVIVLLFTIKFPYSIYMPGGSVDLNDRIDVEGKYEVKGSFNMAYVSVSRGSIPFMLMSKVIPDWDLVKEEDMTIPGEDMDEMVAREKLYLQESMDNAIINAYKKAGKKIEVKSVINSVSYIAKEAKTDLEVKDNIVSINGEEIDSLEDLKAIISKLDENVEVKFEVIRDDKKRDAHATTFKVDGETKVGISIVTTHEYEEDPEIEIKEKASEMGSSGGLMMSLTIYNQLVEEDITKGKKIVGTGTIDKDGNVGEIGGVKYKLIGAVKSKADAFICPMENYEEAMKVKKDKDYDIKIIKAGTFDEALEELKDI